MFTKLFTAHLVAALTVVLVSGDVHADNTARQEAADWFTQIGKRFYRDALYGEAAQEFEKALLMVPGHDEATYYIGLLRLRAIDADETPPPGPAATRNAAIEDAVQEASRILRWFAYAHAPREDSAPPTEAAQDAASPRMSEREPARKPELDLMEPGRVATTGALAQHLRPQADDARPTGLEHTVSASRPRMATATSRQTDTSTAEVAEVLDDTQQSPEANVKPRIGPTVQDVARQRIFSATTAHSAGEQPVASSAQPKEAADEAPPVRPTGAVGIQVAVDGVPLLLERPVVLEGGQQFYPLRSIAVQLSYSVIQLGEGRIELISPLGERRGVTLTSPDPTLVITEAELREHFMVRTRYDEASRTLFLLTDTSTTLRTYAVPKSAEQLQAEAESQRLLVQAQQVPEAAAGVPPAARPDVDLAGTVAYSFEEFHTQAPFRSLTTVARGRVFDFDLSYESLWKDIDGVFDRDFTFLNLRRSNLFLGFFDQRTDLDPLRSQFEEFEGVKVRKVWGAQPADGFLDVLGSDPERPLEATDIGQYATTLAWGTTETTTSGALGSVKYLGHLSELRQEVVPTDWLRLEGGLYFLENEADLPSQSGTSRLPRTNLVSFGEAGILLPHEVVLSGQLAQAYYEPDNNPDRSVRDWNWRTALDWTQERYRVQLAYEFVGDDYASVGDPAIYQDYEGTSLYSTYRLTDRWSLSGTFLRYRDNVDRHPDLTTVENQLVSLSSAYQLTSTQLLNIHTTQTVSNPSGPEAGSSNRGTAYGIDYFFPFVHDTRLLTTYQYTRNEAPAASDTISHAIGGSLLKTWEGGSSWYVSPRFRKTFRELADDDLNLTTTVNVTHQTTPALATYANSTYSRDLTNGSAGTDTLAATVGARYRWGEGTTVGVEFDTGPYDLDLDSGSPRDWSVLFVISQALDFSTKPTFGRIEGVVFHDLNENGHADPGEPRVADALVHQKMGRSVSTGSDGRFTFSRLVPGETEHLHLDLANLEAAWTLAEPHRSVTVERRATKRIDFPLVRAASIQGTVFLDDNDDAVFQETEEPLERVAVVLQPGDEFRRTSPDGTYQFDYLVPGAYHLAVHAADLPKGYELVSPDPVELTVHAGDQVDRVDFAVQLAGRTQQF